MIDDFIPPEEIEAMLYSEDASVRQRVARNSSVNGNYISIALTDNNRLVRAAAIQNPNASVEHITTALDDPEMHVRAHAIRHPNAKDYHRKKAETDVSQQVREYWRPWNNWWTINTDYMLTPLIRIRNEYVIIDNMC